MRALQTTLFVLIFSSQSFAGSSLQDCASPLGRQRSDGLYIENIAPLMAGTELGDRYRKGEFANSQLFIKENSVYLLTAPTPIPKTTIAESSGPWPIPMFMRHKRSVPLIENPISKGILSMGEIRVIDLEGASHTEPYVQEAGSEISKARDEGLLSKIPQFEVVRLTSDQKSAITNRIAELAQSDNPTSSRIAPSQIVASRFADMIAREIGGEGGLGVWKYRLTRGYFKDGVSYLETDLRILLDSPDTLPESQFNDWLESHHIITRARLETLQSKADKSRDEKLSRALAKARAEIARTHLKKEYATTLLTEIETRIRYNESIDVSSDYAVISAHDPMWYREYSNFKKTQALFDARRKMACEPFAAKPVGTKLAATPPKSGEPSRGHEVTAKE